MDKEIDKRTAEAMIEFVKTFASLNADNMRRVHDYICDCQYKSDPVASVSLIHFASVKVIQSPA